MPAGMRCEIYSKLAPLDVMSEICCNIITGLMVQCSWTNRDPSLQTLHDWHQNLRFGMRIEKLGCSYNKSILQKLQILAY